MAYEEAKRTSQRVHNVIMEGRARLAITGVEEVESFDENEIIMLTSLGNLIVRGDNLHVGKLTLDSGDISVDGHISELCYEEPRQGGGLFKRLFK